MFNRTDTLVSQQTQSVSMTIIEIRPFRNGWKCFEAPGVEPVFLSQEQAIDYATCRACFRSGEIRILDCDGAVERIIPFSDADRKL
ncbi:MAG: hypothetical protein DME76_06690 [Verrucomicrobia bacterium]|nr:MAG: hypothetical protein DME76_06690 [Verrucomicrobiota bacterium]